MNARNRVQMTALALAAMLVSVASAQVPQLANLSVRTQVDGTGPVIAGFTLGPTDGGTLVLRAIGPSLAAFGVGNPLADPRLEVFDTNGRRIAENDDFNAADSASFAAAGAFPLLTASRDAALVAALPAGTYTMHVSGPIGARGEVLIEAYLLGTGSSRLTNLSIRAPVRTDGGVITGFTVTPGSGQRRLLVRAIGPTLGEFGVTGAASAPRLEVYSGSTRIAENANWSEPAAGSPDWITLTSAFLSSGAFPLARISGDAAVLRDFAPGSHTLIARSSTSAGAGVALVEIYEAPDVPTANLPAVTAQSFLVSEFVGPGYFVQVDLGLRVIATSPGTVSLRTLKFTTYEKSGQALNIRPIFPLNMDVGPGVMVELLRRGTPQNTALYYEIDPDIDRVMAEVTYVDSTGQEGVMTTTTRVRRL